MKLNILVVTKYKWTTRAQKHREAKAILQRGNFEDISITTQIRDVGTPKLNAENRIDSEWFENTITRDARTKGYNFVIWQFSRADGKRWGIESRIHGLNFRDGDFYGESWVCCDEQSVWKFKDGTKRNEYPKSIAHETLMADMGFRMVRTTRTNAQAGLDPRSSDPKALLRMSGQTMDQQTASTILGVVDAAILRGRSVMLYGHDIDPTPATLTITQSEWDAIIAGLALRSKHGLIDVVTCSEFHDQLYKGIRVTR